MPDLTRRTRPDLDALAEKVGVTDPEDLPTKDDVAEAIEEHKGSYTVTGPRAVFGHAPGTDFTAVIPAAQEARLIAAGHIKRKRSTPED